jgi:uroporphyrinogen-III synthase
VKRARAGLSRKSGKAKPLIGRRILVGRARHQAGALSSRLRKLGARVIEIPFIEIRKPRSFRPLDNALKKAAAYDWLILTSVNGVDALWSRLRRLRLDRTHLQHLKIAAIGPATKKAIAERGLEVDVMPEEYVAESVVRSLRHQVRNKKVLLVRARIARDVIPRQLREAGAVVDVVEAYETILPRASRPRLRAALGNSRRRPDVITFTSSSTARNFLGLLGKISPRILHGVKLASIGPVTSATLRELGLRVDIQAAQFTIPGLISAIVSANKRDQRQQRKR